MSDAPEVFQAYASDYEAARRRLVPGYDAFYGAAVEAVGMLGRPPGTVLDLGAGTGLLSRRVLEAHPAAQLTLLDAAPAMLAEAEKALGTRATYVVGDLADELPDGPWDAVVSALAIHHVTDDTKRTLFARVHEALAPGGVFVNAEQVAAPTRFLEDVHAKAHEAHARAAGSDDAEWVAARGRMEADRCATLDDQLGWLREAGFADVDCIYKRHSFAVLVARG
jgi:tRNA (cmo5U34)-methyltransferase